MLNQQRCKKVSVSIQITLSSLTPYHYYQTFYSNTQHFEVSIACFCFYMNLWKAPTYLTNKLSRTNGHLFKIIISRHDKRTITSHLIGNKYLWWSSCYFTKVFLEYVIKTNHIYLWQNININILRNSFFCW